MAAPTRTEDQRERDLEEIARLYLQGWSQRKIGEQLKISQQQVSYDLAEIRRRWLESSIRSFDEAKSRELAKIDHLEQQAWEGWNRTIGIKKKTSTKVGVNAKGPVDEETETLEELAGDPRFLQVVDTCIQRRCKILGIDAEIKALDLNAAIAATVRAGFIVTAPNEEV